MQHVSKEILADRLNLLKGVRLIASIIPNYLGEYTKTNNKSPSNETSRASLVAHW